MSEEALKGTLRNFGFTDTEAEVYLFISKHSALKGTEIAKYMGKDKAQVYHTLRTLQTKGYVESTFEAPVRFIPVSFETVLELAIKAKKNEVSQIESARRELLDYWKSTHKPQSALPVEKFVVLNGRHQIYSKVGQMVNSARKQLLLISTVPSLLRADQFGLFDEANNDPEVKYRFVTKLSDENIASVRGLFNEWADSKLNFNVKSRDITANLSPRMVIRDDKEALFFITPPPVGGTEEYDGSCLWTNCGDLVQAFTTVFEDIWVNSTDTQLIIRSSEKGKSFTGVGDEKLAPENFLEALKGCKKEVFWVTSPAGLLAISKNMSLLRNWLENGVTAKILAPITNETQEAVKDIGSYIEIRHVTSDYIETAIIDNTHLFQFNEPSKVTDSKPFNDRQAIYSNNIEFIQKTRKMLESVWLTAQEPSATTLTPTNETKPNNDTFYNQTVPKTIQKMHSSKILSHKEPEKIENRQIIEEMIWSPPPDNSEVIAKTFGTNCQAIVRLPAHFNIPKTLFHVYHIERQSTYGRENALLLHPWLETPQGYAYVFSALFTDNPKALDLWKKVCANSPAEQNIHLINEEALEVRVHGNTLFAGWTVPLQLSKSCTIPPCCLLVEGYGNTRSYAYTVVIPSGYKLKTEVNYNEAFVTFLHPMSKYSGPGTDGAIGRDTVMEFIKL